MKIEKIVRETADFLKTEPENLPNVIKKFQKEIEDANAEIKKLKADLKKR